ncbi:MULTISPECIES: hypothetical protein [unclassified Streptomyces]|nr:MULTISPECIES: hypothetical protein [unclassified Streptomyces]
MPIWPSAPAREPYWISVLDGHRDDPLFAYDRELFDPVDLPT